MPILNNPLGALAGLGVARGKVPECNITVQKTTAGASFGKCSALDESDCISKDGTLLLITNADCSKECACGYTDANGFKMEKL